MIHIEYKKKGNKVCTLVCFFLEEINVSSVFISMCYKKAL